MGDQYADDHARGEVFAPIGETLTVELAVIRKRADGGKPAAMTLLQPDEKLLMRTRVRASFRNERRLVTAQRGSAKGIIFIHPFGPANMLKDIGDRATTPAQCCHPIFFPQVLKVGEQGMRRVAVERFFDKPGECIKSGMGICCAHLW